ncbi:ABC transporter permease [Microbacterium pumilum]|uniref:ABC transporter permease n=1 Tax=Microbacterium pumilum TaxID=344165 RepID=A0ABN2T213_9MICO
MSRVWLVISQVLFVVAILVGWELAASTGVLNSFLVGQPSKIAQQLGLWIADGSIWFNTGATVFTTFLGYVAALVVGVIIGSFIGSSAMMEKIAAPFLSFWQGFPRLVFYPFFAVMLGYSIASRAVHVAFVIVFVIIVATATGVASADRDVRQHARILGASPTRIFVDVDLPSATAWIAASARVTFGLAIQAAIVAEFTGAQNGLGYLMVLGQNSFNVNVIWAATSIAVFVAFAIDMLIVRSQRYFDRWAVRADSA